MCHGAHCGEGLVLTILAMLAALRVAAGGSAPPITFVARRGMSIPGRDGEAGLPIEPRSRVDDVNEGTKLSRSGLSVTSEMGVQLRVCPLQRRGFLSRARW